jgi:hypothetical protein
MASEFIIRRDQPQPSVPVAQDMQSRLTTPDDELDTTALIPAGDPSKDFPPEPKNFGETPTFGRLTLLFEALGTERKQDKRTATLQKWFGVRTCLIRGVANI